ncbi:MAG TPA: GntR family transcriptional regulator [Dokdonella sp.]
MARTRFDKLPSRSSYAAEVYRVLLDAISDGSLAPGARLTQEEIAEQFEVSRMPVLQALQLLKKDGFVREAPGRGLLVAPLDVEWIGKLYEVRGALDALAARLAAERRSVVDAALIARGRRASAGSSVKAMIEADMNFHLAIYRASDNPLIEESARLHWAHLRRAMGAVLQSSGQQRKAIWDEHEAIADAIARGDARLAAKLTDVHTTHARENVVSRLGEILGRAASA